MAVAAAFCGVGGGLTMATVKHLPSGGLTRRGAACAGRRWTLEAERQHFGWLGALVTRL